MEYRHAREEELENISKLSAESFGKYPFYDIILRDGFDSDEDYLRFLRTVHLVHIRSNLKKHYCFVGEENGELVCIALLQSPDKKPVSLLEYVAAGGVKIIMGAGLSRTMKFLSMTENARGACDKLEGGRLWYLELLAVKQNRKGQSLGSQMINECVVPFVRSHGGGQLALITNSEHNRGFYKKNSFTEFDSSTIEANGKTIGNWSYKMEIAAEG